MDPAGRALSRGELVIAARDTIARGSKSFATASTLFDARTRERAWLLYAWCRACDDIVDGQELGGARTMVTDPQVRIAVVRDLTERALAGEATGEPAFDALGVVAAETGMPHRLPRDLIAGFAMDADDWRPRTEDDLLRYCYHVAGVVGVMMAIIMGVKPDDEAVLDRACDLGLAFQLANIARDLSEDDAVGRCYLPIEWLVEIDVPPGEVLRPVYRERLGMLGLRLAQRAGAYEESARYGTPALSFRSAWAVLSAAGIYGDIAREVGRRGAHAWDRRVVVTRKAKLGWVAKAAWQAAQRNKVWRGDAARAGLWTRPRG